MGGAYLQRQREEAKRTGRFIDLTNMADDDGEIRQAQLAIKREEAEEVAQERQAVVDKAKKEKEKLSVDVVSLPPQTPHKLVPKLCDGAKMGGLMASERLAVPPHKNEDEAVGKSCFCWLKASLSVDQ